MVHPVHNDSVSEKMTAYTDNLCQPADLPSQCLYAHLNPLKVVYNHKLGHTARHANAGDDSIVHQIKELTAPVAKQSVNSFSTTCRAE